MSLLKILKYPDPKLKKVAKQVLTFDANLKIISEDMLETMYSANGVGLAATQVGIDLRIIVVDCSETRDQPLVLINPVIAEYSGNIEWNEGCLSFPGVHAKVKRYAQINLTYQDTLGQAHSIEASDLLAVCFQHEIDHLNGITFFDHLSPLKQKLLRKKFDFLDN